MTDSKHVINLRGPWQWADAPASDGEAVSGFQRFQFPDDLATLRERTDSSRILLARAFGRPSGLTDQHRVELVVDSLVGCHDIILNDEPLILLSVEDGTGRCDITSLIQWRNGLRISCELMQPIPGQSERLHEVRIEILEVD